MITSNIPPIITMSPLFKRLALLQYTEIFKYHIKDYLSGLRSRMHKSSKNTEATLKILDARMET